LPDPAEFLDVEVDQLAGPLVALPGPDRTAAGGNDPARRHHGSVASPDAPQAHGPRAAPPPGRGDCVPGALRRSG